MDQIDYLKMTIGDLSSHIINLRNEMSELKRAIQLLQQEIKKSYSEPKTTTVKYGSSDSSST